MLLAHLEHRPQIETALLETFGKLLDKYREHPPATAALPVMHISATATDTESKARGLNCGAQAYLIEPLDVAEFLATVRSLR